MSSDSSAGELSVEELRELIPQLQQLTDKYKRAELVQKALFDISELAGSVGELSRLYPAIHHIIGEFMNALNFYVAIYEQEEEVVDFVYFVDQFDEQTVTHQGMIGFADDRGDGSFRIQLAAYSENGISEGFGIQSLWLKSPQELILWITFKRLFCRRQRPSCKQARTYGRCSDRAQYLL